MEVRYIGKTKKSLEKRLYGHMYTKGEHTYKSNWISLLKSINLRPIIEKVEECDENTWKEAEIRNIKLFREMGAKLTNSTKGGEGIEFTKEIREKISIANKGRIISLEHREINRKAQLGRKHSSAHSKAIGDAQKGKVISEETNAKRVETRRKIFQEKVNQLTPLILNMYRDGISQIKIGKAVHMEKGQIRKILKENNVKIRNRYDSAILAFKIRRSESI